jgi:ABC-type multidrug transport system fused ATPase/permease subunit
MPWPWRRIAGWYHAVLTAGLPWLLPVHPGWAMLVVAAILPTHRLAVRHRVDEPWRSLLIAASAMAAVGQRSDAISTLVAMMICLTVAAGGALRPESDGRPDGWDALVAAVCAIGAILRPTMTSEAWISAGTFGLVALAARRSLALIVAARPRSADPPDPTPPARDVRGTVCLSGVLCDGDGLPRTTPLDLEIRAGRSVAVVCDASADAESLMAALSGRRAPRAGGLTVDAQEVDPVQPVVAVVAPGEAFLPGPIEANLGALTLDGELTRDQVAALHESFGLGEVVSALDGRLLERDGAPLSPYHRLLLLAARVVPSSYRVLVVMDPRPWVNAIRAQVWRHAVVRASVGRTAVWITDDPELLRRADEVWSLRHGALKPGGEPGAGGE